MYAIANFIKAFFYTWIYLIRKVLFIKQKELPDKVYHRVYYNRSWLTGALKDMDIFHWTWKEDASYIGDSVRLHASFRAKPFLGFLVWLTTNVVVAGIGFYAYQHYTGPETQWVQDGQAFADVKGESAAPDMNVVPQGYIKTVSGALIYPVKVHVNEEFVIKYNCGENATGAYPTEAWLTELLLPPQGEAKSNGLSEAGLYKLSFVCRYASGSKHVENLEITVESAAALTLPHTVEANSKGIVTIDEIYCDQPHIVVVKYTSILPDGFTGGGYLAVENPDEYRGYNWTSFMDEHAIDGLALVGNGLSSDFYGHTFTNNDGVMSYDGISCDQSEVPATPAIETNGEPFPEGVVDLFDIPDGSTFLGFGNHKQEPVLGFTYSQEDKTDFANTVQAACESFVGRTTSGEYYGEINVLFDTRVRFAEDGQTPMNTILVNFVGDGTNTYFGVLPGTGQRISSNSGRVDLYHCGYWYVIFQVPDGK